MQFKVVAVLFLTTVASAADIIGWTGNGCVGTSLACRGIEENICCSMSLAPPLSPGVPYRIIATDWTP